MTLWARVFEERRRVVLPLVIALVANVAALVIAVLPLQRIVAASDTRAREMATELAIARRLESQARGARASKERASEELRTFYRETLPADASSAQKITNYWLQEAARGAGLRFRGARFESDEVRGSRLSRAFSRVTLQGRYPDIRRFLHEIEAAEEFIVVERVELAESDANTAGGVLEVSLGVATYFLTTPQP